MTNWTDKKEMILAASLPNNGKKYGIIPHSILLDELEEKLYAKGHEITKVKYLTANNNQIITGVYRLKTEGELDISPSVTFVNSYNRTRKAEIKIGMEVLICTNGMIGTSGHAYSRKHIGNTALADFRDHIDKGIDSLPAQIEILNSNVKQMKEVELTEKSKALLIGDMLINESMINSTQMSIVQKEINFSEHFKTDSLWDFYNHITESYKSSHPMIYDKQHVKFHTYIQDVFNLEGSRKLFKKENFNLQIN